MTNLIFLGDIHDEDGTILRSVNSCKEKFSDKEYALLVEFENEKLTEMLAGSDLVQCCQILFSEKKGEEDKKIVREWVKNSNNRGTYAFDAKGAGMNLARHNKMQSNINILLNFFVKKFPKLSHVVVVVGEGHLTRMENCKEWMPLQDAKYSNVRDVYVGLPSSD